MSNFIHFDDGQQAATYELATFGQRGVARLIDTVILFIPNYIIPIIPSWLYWASLQSGQKQATQGQRAVGIMVIDTNGNQPTFGLTTARFFFNFLNILTFFLGYLMFFFNKGNQCLHDFFSSCVVVKQGSADVGSHEDAAIPALPGM